MSDSTSIGAVDPRFVTPPAEVEGGSTSIIRPAQGVAEDRSPIDPRNPVLYSGLELDVFTSLIQAKKPDPTLHEITREAQRGIPVIDPRYKEPPSDFEETPVIDPAGRTKIEREVLDRFKEKKYTYSHPVLGEREVSLGEMRKAHFFYQELKKSFKLRSGKSDAGFEFDLMDDKGGIHSMLKNHSIYLASEFPDDPFWQRQAMSGYALAKTLTTDALIAGQTLLNVTGDYVSRTFDNVFQSEEYLQKEYKDKSLNPLTNIVSKFEQISGDFYGDGPFSMRNMRPHIIDVFEVLSLEKGLELPPDYAKIVATLEGPDQIFASYVAHYLGTGIPAMMGVRAVRKGIRAATHNKLEKFHKASGSGKALKELDGSEMGALVDDFVRAQLERRIPIISRPFFKDVRNNAIRRRLAGTEYMQARKSARQRLEEEAVEQGISRREMAKRRLREPTLELRRLQRDPNATVDQINAAQIKVTDIATENMMARRFGIYDPITKDEAVAESMFIMGASSHDYLMRSENYFGTDSEWSIISGMAALIFAPRGATRLSKELEGRSREAFMAMNYMLKNSDALSSKERADLSIKMMDRYFGPQASIRLQQGQPVQAVRADKSLYYSRLKESGAWNRLPKEHRDVLAPIFGGIAGAGYTDEVIEQIATIDKYRKVFQAAFGNSDDFDTGFAAIVALQPLLALTDTTKTSLSGVLGTVKIGELQAAIGQAMQGTKFFNQAKQAFDNLTVAKLREAGITDPGLIDMINTLQGAKTLGEELLGGTILDLNNHLARAISEFKINKGTFQDYSVTTAETANLLDNAKRDLDKLIEDLGVDTTEGTTLDVGMRQLDKARSTAEVAQQALEARDKAAEAAQEQAQKLGEGLTRPGFERPTGTRDAIVYQHIERGELEKAAFELALNVRDTKIAAFNERYARLYGDIRVGDDTEFVGNMLAKFLKFNYGESLEDALIKIKNGKNVASDIKPVVRAIEDAAGKKLDAYYDSLGTQGQQERLADAEAFNEAFPDAPFIINWLQLKTLQDTGKVDGGLDWTLHDLDILRRTLQDRAQNLGPEQQGDLLDLAKSIDEEIDNTLRRSEGGENAVKERQRLSEDYRDEVRIPLYESELGKLVHKARSQSGFLEEGTLLELFNLNNTVLGDNKSFTTFKEQMESFFGTPEARLTEQAGEGTVYRQRTAPNFVLTADSVTKGAGGEEMQTGRMVQAILRSLTHSSLIATGKMKGINLDLNKIAGWNDQADTRKNMFKNISALDDEAIERLKMLEGRMAQFPLLDDLGSKEFTGSLETLIAKSQAVQDALERNQNEILILAQNTRAMQRSMAALSNDVINITASDVFRGTKITSIDELIETFRGADVDQADLVTDFIDRVSIAFKNSMNPKHRRFADMSVTNIRLEVKEALHRKVMQHVRNKTFGVERRTTDIVKASEYNPSYLTDFIADNENLIRALLPDNLDKKIPRVRVYQPQEGQTLDMLKENYMEMLKDFGEAVKILNTSGEGVAKGLMSYSTKGLSPSSWISRIYAIDRGVVSPRYVLTEALLVKLRKTRGNDLQAALEDPELLYYMNKILQTRQVLPESEVNAFNRVLKKAIAYNVNANRDPEVTGEDTLQEIQQFEQNIMAQSAGVGGDFVPQTRMPEYPPIIPTEVVPGQPS